MEDTTSGLAEPYCPQSSFQKDILSKHQQILYLLSMLSCRRERRKFRGINGQLKNKNKKIILLCFVTELCHRACRNSNIVSLFSGKAIHHPHMKDPDLILREEIMVIPKVCEEQHHSASKWTIFPFKPSCFPIPCFTFCPFLIYRVPHLFFMIFSPTESGVIRKKNRSKNFISQKHLVPEILNSDEYLAVAVKSPIQVSFFFFTSFHIRLVPFP